MTLEERIAQLEAMKKRTQDQNEQLEKLQGELTSLRQATSNASMQKQIDDKDAELKAFRLKEVETTRKQEITKVAGLYQIEDEMLNRYLNDATKTVQNLTDELLELRGKNNPTIVTTTSSNEDTQALIGDAIYRRLGGKSDLPNNRFAHAPIGEMARQLTGAVGYADTQEKLISRAMTTSNLPILLVENTNRRLEEEFDEQMATYKSFVREVDVDDFRQQKDATAGGLGRLKKVPENGQLPETKIKENAETWELDSYGEVVNYTRQAMVNDDLGVFNNIIGNFAEASSNTANGITYDLLRRSGDFSGYKMADGLAPFHATHKNLSSLPLSGSALTSVRTAMRRQVNLNKEPANVTPTYLIVSPELEHTALELLNSVGSLENEKNAGVVNIHNKSLQLIVDAELVDDEWYVLANRRTIKVGYLAGTGRRPIIKMDNVTDFNTKIQCVFDFGAMFEDYRGAHKGK